MKLVMTLLVRDEDDIIASNIDFHLNRGVDFIIAMDNLSVERGLQDGCLVRDERLRAALSSRQAGAPRSKDLLSPCGH